MVSAYCLDNSWSEDHKEFHSFQKLRLWSLPLTGLFCILMVVVLASCTSNSSPSDIPMLEMGVILDFEFSPGETLLAVIVPEEAKVPGSPDYDTVVLNDVIDNWQIVIYETKTFSPKYVSPLYSDTQIGGITNLRWLNEESLLFLLWRDKTTYLVQWNVVNNDWNQYEFGYRNFDISSNAIQIVAWHHQTQGLGLDEIVNKLVFIDYPSLRQQKTITLNEIDVVSDVFWVEDGNWIMIGSVRMQMAFSLDPESERLEPIISVPRGTLDMRIDARGELLLTSSLTQWQIIDIGTQCLLEQNEQILNDLEWSNTQKSVHFVISNGTEKTETLFEHDASELLKIESMNCPDASKE